MTDVTAAVRRQLIARRRQLGLKQSDVADIMGVHQSLISDLERIDGRNIGLLTAERWAGALGCIMDVSFREDDLMGGGA